jgi:hypothetical protein
MPAHTWTEIKQQLRHLHRERLKACVEDRTLRKVETAVRDAAHRLAGWRPAVREFASCRPGLIRAHQRCRRALLRASSSGRDVDFHEWRKRLSVVRDHLILIAPLGSEMHAEALAAGSERSPSLGDDHNLVVLGEILERLSTEKRPIIELDRLRRSLARRQRQLHKDALTGASEICLRDSDEYAPPPRNGLEAGPLRTSLANACQVSHRNRHHDDDGHDKQAETVVPAPPVVEGRLHESPSDLRAPYQTAPPCTSVSVDSPGKFL